MVLSSFAYEAVRVEHARPHVESGAVSTLSRNDLAHLARLARLAVTDEELDLYAGQLSAVLDAVPQVQKAPVEDVPPSDPAPWEGDAVPLGRVFPGRGSVAPRIVIYRRPVEARPADERELAQVVHDVVVEQVAALLGVRPGEVDRRYDEGDD